MEKNKEKDTDKILGMNRVMFFIIVILLCILLSPFFKDST